MAANKEGRGTMKVIVPVVLLSLVYGLGCTKDAAETMERVNDKYQRDDAEIKKRAGDKYQSIESFFRNLEYMKSMHMINQGNAERHPQEKLDAMKGLADKILDEDKLVDEKKLNQIYANWGSKYKTKFVKGTKILARGLQQLEKEDFGVADGFYAQWDTWWRDNHSNILSTLHSKFGFEVK